MAVVELKADLVVEAPGAERGELGKGSSRDPVPLEMWRIKPKNGPRA